MQKIIADFVVKIETHFTLKIFDFLYKIFFISIE